jgi:hypothetical protein
LIGQQCPTHAARWAFQSRVRIRLSPLGRAYTAAERLKDLDRLAIAFDGYGWRFWIVGLKLARRDCLGCVPGTGIAGHIAQRSIGSKHAPHAGVAVVWHDRTDLAASPIEIRSTPCHLHRDDMVPNYTRQNASNLTAGASKTVWVLAKKNLDDASVPRLLPRGSAGWTNTTRILLQTCNTIVPFYRPGSVNRLSSIPEKAT